MDRRSFLIGAVALPLYKPVARWTVCDLIELNQVLDPDTGKLRLSQWVFWDVIKGEGWRVVDWRMAYQPYYQVDRFGGWYWMRGYRVKARTYRISSTFHDIEVENRKIFNQADRRGIPIKQLEKRSDVERVALKGELA